VASVESGRDPLTGLVNRRGFERLFRMAIATAEITGWQHGFCLLDIDQLKAVNDACGNDAGDGVLRAVAAVIQGTVPGSAWVARLGGDEFGILLKDCPLERARLIAEEVVRAVGDSVFTWNERTLRVGLSVGLVEVPREQRSFEDAMGLAEWACFAAKSRAIPVFHFGMDDPVAARQGRAILELVRFFLPRCTRRSTLLELEEMAADNERWRYAHALFSRIRVKALAADATADRRLQCQYSFEEICAKTLYNLSGHVPGGEWPFPFDRDSPSRVMPIAVGFAQELGVEDALSAALTPDPCSGG
jgi:diguanylate cyclase (GGDEF)-like protein